MTIQITFEHPVDGACVLAAMERCVRYQGNPDIPLRSYVNALDADKILLGQYGPYTTTHFIIRPWDSTVFRLWWTYSHILVEPTRWISDCPTYETGGPDSQGALDDFVTRFVRAINIPYSVTNV